MIPSNPILLSKKGFIYKLSHIVEQKAIKIFIVNETDKSILESKLHYEELDLQTAFLFDSIEDLFKHLENLCHQRFEVVQGIVRYYLSIRFRVFGKSRFLVLPINTQSNIIQNNCEGNSNDDKEGTNKQPQRICGNQVKIEQNQQQREQLIILNQIVVQQIQGEQLQNKENSKKRSNPFQQQTAIKAENNQLVFKELRSVPSFADKLKQNSKSEYFQITNNICKYTYNKQRWLVSKVELPTYQRYTIGLRIISSKLNRIAFGVAADSIKYIQCGNYLRYITVQYRFYDNVFVEVDNKINEQIPLSKKGETVNITIDPRNYSFELWVDGVFRIKRIMLDAFRAQKLYPFILMEDAGDTVQMI